jgi:molybdopterin biosynthesis enzyme
MVHDLGTVPLADLDRALYRATTAPVVLVMGPKSVVISDALAQAGFEVRVSEISLDPCEEVVYGVIRGESGRVESHLFWLSSSPAAALVAATLLVGPLVARLQGEAPADSPRRRYAVWTGPQNATDHRTRAVPVQLMAGDDARLQALPISYRGVDDLAGFASADALALFPPNAGPWIGGELVEVVPIGQAFIRPDAENRANEPNSDP